MALDALRSRLLEGLVIPAHPLALTERRRLDERAQRALTRYYIDAGAGGIAVGVHTTQFAIRAPEHGLYEPVLALASETAEAWRPGACVKVAGLVGRTPQALAEARIALDHGYHAGLLSLGAWGGEPEEAILAHCREVAAAIPLFGFYLQPAVGGRPLSYAFWRAFAEIEPVVAIKIAPFNRYQTLDVVRAVSDAGRDDIALYTGNDDSILVDLLTPFPTARREGAPARRIVGGLLGHWAVWTHAAARMMEEVKRRRPEERIRVGFLHQAAAITDMNGALFDVRHGFAGSIPGILEVLRRQRLVRGTWCLDPAETLSPGQSEEIDRVTARYAHLTDDEFVAERRDAWME